MKGMFVSDLINMKYYYRLIAFISAVSAAAILTGNEVLVGFVNSACVGGLSALAFMSSVATISNDIGSKYREFAIASFVRPRNYLAEKYILTITNSFLTLGLAFIIRFIGNDLTPKKIIRFFEILIILLTINVIFIFGYSLEKSKSHITRWVILIAMILYIPVIVNIYLFPIIAVYDIILVIVSFCVFERRDFDL